MKLRLTCHYCTRPMFNIEGPRMVTTDHIIPRCRGGGGESNTVLACRDCNELKGELTAEEFEAAILWAVAEGVELEQVGEHYRPLQHQVTFNEFFRLYRWWPKRLAAGAPVGFFAGLTPEQREAALAYRGPENFGELYTSLTQRSK